jgi:hypothetical protein
MTEYRVVFDFEIDFSNGGGIQGQDFRLDIEGNAISDDDLAAYIARDLRLLMVGETRILNKSIIKEAHKREKSPSAEGENAEMQAASLLANEPALQPFANTCRQVSLTRCTSSFRRCCSDLANIFSRTSTSSNSAIGLRSMWRPTRRRMLS